MTGRKVMLATYAFIFIYDQRNTWQARHDLFTLLTVKVAPPQLYIIKRSTKSALCGALHKADEWK